MNANISEIIAQLITFLILFFLLRAFAWKKILKLLDERGKKISSEFDKIDEAKVEIEKMKFDYEEKLKAIEDAASVKIQEAIAEGKNITQELKQQAHKEAEKILQTAKTDIQNEIIKSKEELKEEVADIVIKATERLMEEKITEEKDKKLVRYFVEGIEKTK